MAGFRLCGILAALGPPRLITNIRPLCAMPLLPKTSAEWTRSLAVPLFVACILVITALWFGGHEGGRQWRYWGGPIARLLLPFLGVALGLTCILGKGLPRGFRITASV